MGIIEYNTNSNIIGKFVFDNKCVPLGRIFDLGGIHLNPIISGFPDSMHNWVVF